MDPLIDERLILTTSAAFMELAYDWLGIAIKREAYGPTDNEGLCYEYCVGVPFKGELSGELFVAMDGYTKLLILPYIARRFKAGEHHPEMAENALIAFANQLANMVITEVQEFMGSVFPEDPRILSHKICPLPADKYRKYMMIYFLRDDERKVYLGRLYLALALEK